MAQWKGIAMVLGATLTHLSLGTIYTYGNTAPYLASYYRNVVGQEVALSELTWVYSAMMGCMGLCMSLGGLLERRLGVRWTAVLGCSLMCTGILVTYVTVDGHYGWVVVSYGVLYGAGLSLPYISLLSCGMKWFPQRRGLVSGVIVAGFGTGTLVFNIVQTKFLNPHNLLPHSDGFFYEESLLRRVPQMFLLLGAVYAVMQLIGCILAFTPPTPAEDPVLDKLNAVEAKSPLPPSRDLSPGEVLRTREFYLMWLTFFFNANTANFITSMYKIYGQTFIADDLFLALVGSVGAAFNAVGRVLWGLMGDRYSYKACFRLMLCGSLVLLLTFPATQLMGKWPFAAWMLAIHLLMSASYVLLPAFCSKYFGAAYASTNYGLVFSQMALGGPTTGLLTNTLLRPLGFTGLFYLMAAFTLISLLLTIPFREHLYRPQTKKKTQIALNDSK